MMDFPLFHLDFFGNRALIAVIAMIHVFISHPLAVGALPLVVFLERWGQRSGRPEIDRLAHRVLGACFIITTSVGALTGVGIWFSISLVNPAATGALIRFFFWPWFAEWGVFVVEVVLLMLYFLSWKRMRARKDAHVAIGVGLALFSWLTMVIITGILGFMMDPGSWSGARSFWTGFFNPMYLPQLCLRTGLAAMGGGLFGLFLVYFFTRGQRELRVRITRGVAMWTLAWLPVAVVGALWYRARVPQWMVDNNLEVALTTVAYTRWAELVVVLLGVAAAAIVGISLWGLVHPRSVPRVVLLVPFGLSLVLLGYYERVREFVRKPYVIVDYMYANGLRVDDYPLLQEEGLLTHATHTAVRRLSDDNRLRAGRELFRLACTRCHTTTGINGLRGRLEGLYGPGPWDRAEVKAYLGTMHATRRFMPPFPGTDAEASALADYLVSLHGEAVALPGDQTVGIPGPAARSRAGGQGRPGQGAGPGDDEGSGGSGGAARAGSSGGAGE